MEPVIYTPIGVVRSPFTALVGMPIQTVAAKGVAATIPRAQPRGRIVVRS